MSHFSVVVILPNTISHADVKKYVDKVMAPYDENIKVPEYVEPCYCVGCSAQKVSREKADAQTGGVEHARETFKKHLSRVAPDLVDFDSMFGELDKSLPKTEAKAKFKEMTKRKDTLWTAHLKPYREAETAILNAHPDRDRADHKCTDCNGTGTIVSTYNPQSKWDWFQIGGRWQGLFSDYDPDKDPRNREACFICRGTGERNDELGREAREKNPNYTCSGCNGTGITNRWPTERKSEGEKTGDIGPLTYLVEKKETSYAVVTPDGVWRSRGHMGMFGMSSDEDDKWDDHCLNIFKKYVLGFYGVVVDCHI